MHPEDSTAPPAAVPLSLALSPRPLVETVRIRPGSCAGEHLLGTATLCMCSFYRCCGQHSRRQAQCPHLAKELKRDGGAKPPRVPSLEPCGTNRFLLLCCCVAQGDMVSNSAVNGAKLLDMQLWVPQGDGEESMFGGW